MQLQAFDVPGRLPKEAQPVYLVHGDEPLLLLDAADAIRSRLLAQGFDERIVLHAGSGFNWSELYAHGGNLSLFSERKLIELHIPGGKPGVDGAKVLTEFIKIIDRDTCLLLIASTEGAPRNTTAWVKAVDAGGVVVSCRPLRPNQIESWLGRRARAAGLKLEPDAISWLAFQVEGNLLAAAQEIAKLPLLAGEGGRISLDELKEAVADNARFAAWDLPDKALLGDLSMALRMLDRLREEDVAPLIIIASFARDLRSLHAASLHARRLGPDRACEQAGIWRSRKAAFLRALGRHSTTDIRQMLRELGRLDLLAKSAPAARSWEELLNLTVRLAAGRRRRAA